MPNNKTGPLRPEDGAALKAEWNEFAARKLGAYVLTRAESHAKQLFTLTRIG